MSFDALPDRYLFFGRSFFFFSTILELAAMGINMESEAIVVAAIIVVMETEVMGIIVNVNFTEKAGKVDIAT